MPIYATFTPESTPQTLQLRDRVMKAAAIYLGVKNELLQFDGVSEDFARERAEDARDAYLRMTEVR